jgi:serine/threonine protein kinase
MARLPYMDPEFNTTGELTTLSDVYSLGVIILQLLTEMPPLTLSEKVAEALESDSLHLLIDKSAGDWPYIQAKQLALIGLSCTEMTRKKRPDLLTKVWKVVEPLTRKPLAATWPYLQSATGDSCVPSAFICPISLVNKSVIIIFVASILDICSQGLFHVVPTTCEYPFLFSLKCSVIKILMVHV